MMSLKNFQVCLLEGSGKETGGHVSMFCTLGKEDKLAWLLQKLEATQLR